MRPFMRILLSLLLAAAPIAALADPGGVYDGSGAYLFQYGTAMPPTLTCAPNHVCEIRLQEGENVYDVVAGDTIRFIIGRGAEGKDGSIPVIFFQPLDSCQRDPSTNVCVGMLSTNLIITTDRRTYDVRLAANGGGGRTRYGFIYPGGGTATTSNAPMFRALPQTPPAPREDHSVAASASSVGCLETAKDYRIDVSGQPDYVPLVVCNDGVRTYLSMPLRYTAPSIYTVFDNGQQQLVDTHPGIGGIYAISGLPGHIILIGETGKRIPHVDVWKIH